MKSCFDRPDLPFMNDLGRKTIITGHYGSGKTEFSISLAINLAKTFDDIAIIDLDIVNPYFRSREKRDILNNAGISVYGSVYEKEIAAELPALGAGLRAPLENNSCKVIIDTGGNDTGALVLNQFTKYFTDEETTVLAVVNANRPDTSCIDGVLKHIKAIEKITNLNVSAIVNNTHMLRQTTADDILKGYAVCEKACAETGKRMLCNCYPEGIIDPDVLAESLNDLMPLGLYMRPAWLDK